MKRTEEQNNCWLVYARSAGRVAVFALMIFSGCAVGPNYKRPAVAAPETFRFATTSATNSLGDLPWWKVFKDPTLQELIRVAITNNYDIKQAVSRVEQARNVAVAAGAPLFPQIGYGGDVGRGRNAAFNIPAPLKGGTASSAQVNLNAAWELDIWGRIRRLSESARYRGSPAWHYDHARQRRRHCVLPAHAVRSGTRRPTSRHQRLHG
jgi:multidrug efflux system outer membrane protein